MKYEQEFRVAEDVAKVWAFFEQFERVAKCIPGVEKAEVIDSDNVTVVLTQRLGPMSATFEAKVQITERIERQKIEFSSTGKAVRGAIGNFRSTNTVLLASEEGHTRVRVAGDVALGGALGSVGQKVIAKQAEKATTEFSKNLELILSGKETPAGENGFADAGAAPGGGPGAATGVATSAPTSAAVTANHRVITAGRASDLWAKVSAAFSGAALIVSLIVLWHVS